MRMRWKGFELPTRVIVEEETKTDTYAEFTAEPFECGYGITVGNSLRRVLLSSIEGAAPVRLRIDGATHEFTAIPGIYEDVLNIVLNVKGLLVELSPDVEEATVVVEKQGEGPVTAGDFRPANGVTIVNPELVIANVVDDSASFRAEIDIERGRGYKTAEELTAGEQPVGVIPLDATFSPVRRTRWHVEDTRVGQMTNYDRLLLEIWTNGTVRPEEALVEAASILRKHLNPFVKYFDIGPELERESAAAEMEAETLSEEDRELLQKLEEPVSILEPSVRAANCLAAEGIKTLGELVRRNEAEMLQVRNFGKTSLKEIKAKLGDHGLSFGMNVDELLSKTTNEG